MPTEGFSFMFGGTKKRSTLVEEKIVFYPREDSSAPRQIILKDYCPKEYSEFKECLHANNSDENKCPSQKKAITKCANKAFKKVNNDTTQFF